jgi:steroid 5-alpha reductase family enzyme
MMSELFLESYNEVIQPLMGDLPKFIACTTSTPLEFSSCLNSVDPMVGLFVICVFWAVYSLVWSIVGNNCSKVDQIWSITPPLYCWYLFYRANFDHDRLYLMTVLMSLWGIRLTYNFWRRGGYGNLIEHEEDYRWPILRKIIGNKWLFLLFNISFIASYQNLLLMLIALPAYGVMKGASAIGSTDIIITVLFLVFLLIETIADEQHWYFHKKKYSCASVDEREHHPDRDVRDGFLQSGLFTYSRHPNYFAEQSMWVCIYAFSISKGLLNFYFTGVFLLITLFMGSMAFGESITLSKYPKYKEYQQRTSQCFPFFFGERDTKEKYN